MEYVGWNDDLLEAFEKEMRGFNLNLEGIVKNKLFNYKYRESRVAYVAFQFGYHLAAKIPVNRKKKKC